MKLKEVVLLQATKDFLVKSSLVSNPVVKDKQSISTKTKEATAVLRIQLIEKGVKISANFVSVW